MGTLKKYMHKTDSVEQEGNLNLIWKSNEPSSWKKALWSSNYVQYRGLAKYWDHSGEWPKVSLVFEDFKFKIVEV